MFSLLKCVKLCIAKTFFCSCVGMHTPLVYDNSLSLTLFLTCYTNFDTIVSTFYHSHISGLVKYQLLQFGILYVEELYFI